MSDKKTLKDILEEIKTTSDSVIIKAGELQKAGNLAKDFAEVSIQEFDKSPLADNPNIYIKDFTRLKDNLMHVNSSLDTMASLASGINYGTATTMTTISGMQSPINLRANPNYVQFYEQFDLLIDQGKTKDQVVAGIRNLGIDSIHEGKSAIDLIEAAWRVHLQGSNISTSSLIPLRESIAKTLQAIQKKSPQSKIDNWIIDIGIKVALPTITANDLQNLQSEHNIIRNKLSGSKAGNYSRDEERVLLRDGTLHLLRILNIIDKNKLK